MKMKICIPIKNDQGVNSLVYKHFGTAREFIVYDTETFEVMTISNQKENHTSRMYDLLESLTNLYLDVTIVFEIGENALTQLNQAGIRVFRAAGTTIKDNVELLLSSRLIELRSNGCCHLSS